MHRVVNCEEFIGKTVGRRLPIDPLAVTLDQRSSAEEWRASGFSPSIPKGVYRFHSHEEANRWLMDHLTRKQGL